LTPLQANAKLKRKQGEIRMYHPQWKETYISVKRDFLSENTLLKMTRYFNKVAPYEEKLGKDIYEMDQYELVDLFVESGITKLSQIQDYRSVFKQYIDWCMLEKGFKINLLSRIVSTDIILTHAEARESVPDKYFTPSQFQEFLEGIDRAYEARPEYAVYLRALLLALHSGIKGDNLTHLRLSSLDPEHGRIFLESGDILLAKAELMEALRQTAGVDGFLVANKDSERWLTLNGKIYEDTVFRFSIRKSKDGEELRHSSARNLAALFRNKIKPLITEEPLTMSDIYECGLIHYVQDRYKADGYDHLEQDLRENRNAALISRYLSDFGTHMSYSSFKNRFGKVIKYIIKS